MVFVRAMLIYKENYKKNEIKESFSSIQSTCFRKKNCFPTLLNPSTCSEVTVGTNCISGRSIRKQRQTLGHLRNYSCNFITRNQLIILSLDLVSCSSHSYPSSNLQLLLQGWQILLSSGYFMMGHSDRQNGPSFTFSHDVQFCGPLKKQRKGNLQKPFTDH